MYLLDNFGSMTLSYEFLYSQLMTTWKEDAETFISKEVGKQRSLVKTEKEKVFRQEESKERP